jgi:deoxyribodipyrimidine photo-lyase
VAEECQELDIEFHLLLGEAKVALPEFVKKSMVGCVVTDMSPLRVPKSWVTSVQKALPEKVGFYQVGDEEEID